MRRTRLEKAKGSSESGSSEDTSGQIKIDRVSGKEDNVVHDLTLDSNDEDEGSRKTSEGNECNSEKENDKGLGGGERGSRRSGLIPQAEVKAAKSAQEGGRKRLATNQNSPQAIQSRKAVKRAKLSLNKKTTEEKIKSYQKIFEADSPLNQSDDFKDGGEVFRSVAAVKKASPKSLRVKRLTSRPRGKRTCPNIKGVRENSDAVETLRQGETKGVIEAETKTDEVINASFLKESKCIKNAAQPDFESGGGGASKGCRNEAAAAGCTSRDCDGEDKGSKECPTCQMGVEEKSFHAHVITCLRHQFKKNEKKGTVTLTTGIDKFRPALRRVIK